MKSAPSTPIFPAVLITFTVGALAFGVYSFFKPEPENLKNSASEVRPISEIKEDLTRAKVGFRTATVRLNQMQFTLEGDKKAFNLAMSNEYSETKKSFDALSLIVSKSDISPSIKSQILAIQKDIQVNLDLWNVLNLSNKPNAQKKEEAKKYLDKINEDIEKLKELGENIPPEEKDAYDKAVGDAEKEAEDAKNNNENSVPPEEKIEEQEKEVEKSKDEVDDYEDELGNAENGGNDSGGSSDSNNNENNDNGGNNNNSNNDGGGSDEEDGSDGTFKVVETPENNGEPTLIEGSNPK